MRYGSRSRIGTPNHICRLKSRQVRRKEGIMGKHFPNENEEERKDLLFKRKQKEEI